jgi:hypothetical protein
MKSRKNTKQQTTIAALLLFSAGLCLSGNTFADPSLATQGQFVSQSHKNDDDDKDKYNKYVTKAELKAAIKALQKQIPPTLTT